MSAGEAADRLGVSLPSLYAYVKRKGIRSQAVAGKRSRRYWREDIEKIAAGRSDERFIKFDSILVPETQITLITPEGHFYRGQSALALSEHATLEDVAAILWRQKRDDIFPRTEIAVPDDYAAARQTLSKLSTLDQAGSLFPILEAAAPRNYDRSPLGFARTGAELLRWFASMVIDAERPTDEPIHRVLAKGLSAPKGYEDLIRRLLVLFADHELTPPTYAVRAVANTGSTPYQAVLAGLVAHRGQRVTEGNAPRIKRLLSEMLTEDDPAAPLMERYRAGEKIPGFANPLYRGGDARAAALIGVMKEALKHDEEFQKVLTAIHIAQEDLGVGPDLSLLGYFIEKKLKYPARGASIHVVARVTGWIAHAQEQIESGPMVRPRAAYTGILPPGL